MDHLPNVVLPRAYWYAVSVVVLVVGLGLAVWQVKRATSELPTDGQKVRGPGVVQIARAGSHSLYLFRAASQRMDASAQQAWDSAPSANISIRDEQTGSQLAVKKSYETTDLQNTLMARLVDFEVPAPGTYRVEIRPSLEELKPMIRPTMPVEKIGQEVIGLVVGVVIGLAIGAVATITAAAIFVTVLLRRRKFKRQRVRFSAG